MPGNRHFVVALLVTPVLTVGAWFAVGYLASEKPQRAQPGQSYPLVEHSNCRYDSGQCDLRNEDMRVTLSLGTDTEQSWLVLLTSQPLTGALLAITPGMNAVPPQEMLAANTSGTRWTLLLPALPAPGERLRVVVKAEGSHWYGEAGTVFLTRYRTGGSHD